jgi:hypothetical protein
MGIIRKTIDFIGVIKKCKFGPLAGSRCIGQPDRPCHGIGQVAMGAVPLAWYNGITAARIRLPHEWKQLIFEPVIFRQLNLMV